MMSQHGRVGPEHARKQAELRIFQEGSATHALSQKVVAVGPGYRLFLAVPKAPAPAGGWPVLYMLDGNAAFDFLTAEHLALAPGLVVAGIGYDTDRQFARELRTLDFTAPDGPGDGLRPDHVHEGRTAGGAAIFHDRLTGPLRDAAEAGLPIDATAARFGATVSAGCSRFTRCSPGRTALPAMPRSAPRSGGTRR
ncbi:hypothetical protein [Paracoccus thiocyanatus]|uniref:hypothetical protein n=1 Tax=Paracoccus thiocyanatus TaxID=34006 RepID=UPI0021616AA0|nr:hypothetical protein [Paracoccus thiocyanatus]